MRRPQQNKIFYGATGTRRLYPICIQFRCIRPRTQIALKCSDSKELTTETPIMSETGHFASRGEKRNGVNNSHLHQRPAVGIGPTTSALQKRCSTVELRWRTNLPISSYDTTQNNQFCADNLYDNRMVCYTLLADTLICSMSTNCRKNFHASTVSQN